MRCQDLKRKGLNMLYQDLGSKSASKCSGWPRHGENKKYLAVNFSRQGKHREFSKFIFLHRENGANTGKILKILNFLKILLLKWQQGDGAFLS